MYNKLFVPLQHSVEVVQVMYNKLFVPLQHSVEVVYF